MIKVKNPVVTETVGTAGLAEADFPKKPDLGVDEALPAGRYAASNIVAVLEEKMRKNNLFIGEDTRSVIEAGSTSPLNCVSFTHHC